MTRIAIIGPRHFPDYIGGIETHCAGLYPHLARDFFVAAFTSKYADNKNRSSGIKYFPCSSLRSQSFEKLSLFLFALPRIASFRPDIIHFQGMNCAVFIPLSILLGAKPVFTQHSLDFCYPKWGAVAKLFFRLCLLTSRFSKHTICVSDEILDAMQKAGHRKSRLSTINNGIHCPPSSTQAKPFTYLFTACRFVPEKNLVELINFYNYMRQNNTHNGLRLVIAGSSTNPGSYSKLVTEVAQRTPGVELIGPKYGQELHDLYAHASLFIQSSVVEGQPIAPLESLAHGVPVLLSDIPAHRQYSFLDDRYFYKLGDSIDFARKANALLNVTPTVQPIQDIVKVKYSWNRIAKKTARLYRHITESAF